MTLLYIGAFNDTYPLAFGGLINGGDVIYVDGLPEMTRFPQGLCGYETSKDEGTLMSSIERRLEKECDLRAPGVKVEDHYYFFDIGRVSLHYFFNTQDIDMQKNPTLAAMLPGVRTLYMCGFTPNDIVYNMLPSLECIIATRLCITQIPQAFQHLAFPPILEAQHTGDHYIHPMHNAIAFQSVLDLLNDDFSGYDEDEDGDGT